MIPKIKKEIKSFLVEEEGKISKQSLLSIGLLISPAIISGIIASKDVDAGHSNINHANHNNNIATTYDDVSSTATGTHTHHASHGNHNSHSSHGSHSSHASSHESGSVHSNGTVYDYHCNYTHFNGSSCGNYCGHASCPGGRSSSGGSCPC